MLVLEEVVVVVGWSGEMGQRRQVAGRPWMRARGHWQRLDRGGSISIISGRCRRRGALHSSWHCQCAPAAAASWLSASHWLGLRDAALTILFYTRNSIVLPELRKTSMRKDDSRWFRLLLLAPFIPWVALRPTPRIARRTAEQPVRVRLRLISSSRELEL